MIGVVCCRLSQFKNASPRASYRSISREFVTVLPPRPVQVGRRESQLYLYCLGPAPYCTADGMDQHLANEER